MKHFITFLFAATVALACCCECPCCGGHCGPDCHCGCCDPLDA